MRLKHILLAGACIAFGSGTAVAQTTPLPTDNSPNTATQSGTVNANGSPQDAPVTTAAPATPAPSVENGDIIVTAQRRDESLSRTPVSVVVISADTLARAQVTSSDDLRQAAPGLAVRSGNNSDDLNFSLRGESQDPYSNVRPGVLPYVNEVQIGAQGSSGALYDLQSVQVLRGPQGTLFGRSATGGAILFTTQRPTDALGGYISGLYGNYNQAKIEGALNVPLSGDDLLLRVAGFYSRRDGFQYNLYDNQRTGRQRKFGVRPSLFARFGPNITNSLVVDYYKSDSEATVGIISGLLPFTGGAGAPYVPGQFLYAGTATPTATITGECTLQAFVGLGPCPPVNPAVAGFYQGYFSDPRRPTTGLAGALANQQARGPYVIDVAGNNVARNRTTTVTNTTTFDVAPNTQIKNIFGYVDAHTFSSVPASSPFVLSETTPGQLLAYTYHGYSEELQLVGRALSTRLDYVVGGYYSDESATTLQPSTLFDILFGGVQQQNNWKITHRTYAGYGQATYHFGDSGLAATAGVRYTSERVGKEVLQGDSFRAALGNPPPPGYSYDQHQTYNNVSWTLGLQDQLNTSTLLYVASRRAYRSGGYNGIVAPKVGSSAIGGDGYGAERITDAEVGAKFNGRVGTVPFRLNGDFYYAWIDNGQRTAFAIVNGGPAALTANVPEARTYGVEIDGQLRLVKWLTLGGNLNYTHATFSNGNVIVLGVPALYDQVPDTPRYNAAGYADVTIPLGGTISVLAHGDIYYQSSSSTSPRSFNNQGTRIDAYTLANFRLGLQDEAAGWSLTANLKNAFNRVYYAGGLQTGEIYQVNTLVPGEPRTVTAEARFRF